MSSIVQDSKFFAPAMITDDSDSWSMKYFRALRKVVVRQATNVQVLDQMQTATIIDDELATVALNYEGFAWSLPGV